jgi:hypothetical protein
VTFEGDLGSRIGDALDRLERIVALEPNLDHNIEEFSELVEDVVMSNASPRVLLRVSDLERALRAYARGELSSERLQRWASLLETNELVDYEHGANKLIADTLFALATPEINEPLSPDLARRLLDSLVSEPRT